MKTPKTRKIETKRVIRSKRKEEEDDKEGGGG